MLNQSMSNNIISDIQPDLVNEKDNYRHIPNHPDSNTDSETDNESESDTEDSPPRLKYTRLNKLPSQFFTKDPISTCYTHESYFIFATHSGVIHICTPTFQTIRTFKAHRASVLCLYCDGTYFASASMDGTVVIGSIVDDSDIVAYNFSRPIHAVVLWNYNASKSFITGGMSGKVILSSRNWMGRRLDTVVSEGNGPIVGIERVDDLIIWMNDSGINVYNLSLKSMILRIDKPEDSPRSDLYWPRVTFPDLNRVIIAWSNYIWSLKISLKSDDEKVSSSSMSKILPSTASISFRNIPEKEIEIEHVFKMDCLICGISSFSDDLWMILSYEPPTVVKDKLHFNNPDLKLINSITGEVEFEQELGLRDVDNLGLNDFKLVSHIETSTKYYIICAKDAVIAEELQLNDRLDWYLQKEEYFHAWEISEHLQTPLKRLNYGIQYVDSLIHQNEWITAGKYLQMFLQVSDDSNDDYKQEIIKQWETWSNIYIKSDHIIELTDIIPMGLSKSIYSEILEFWINSNQDKFYELINSWDIETFDVNVITSKLEDILRTEESEILERGLILLYDQSLEPLKAIPHMINLKNQDIISYLSKNHILSNFINELPDIIKLRFTNNELETLPIHEIQSRISDIISILVEQRLEITPKVIIQLFDNLPLINFFYLEKLNSIDNYLTQPFGNQLVNLYSQFKRESLLPFLQKGSYDIDQAISICQQNSYFEEFVYLLGRIGQNKRALELITHKLNNPLMAIQFAKRQNDKEVWNSLLDYSMNHANFIKALIENSDESSNAYYDPITILKRMPKDLQVSGLTDSIIEFSNNNDLNMILYQIVLRVIYRQSKEISKNYKSKKLRGYEIELDEKLIQKFETVVLEINDDVKLLLESELTSDPDNSSYINHKKKLIHLQDLQRKLT